MPLFPIGRKAKDQKALAAANESGGTVTIRSKNKITNPKNPAQTLGRGSTVTIARNPQMQVDKPTTIPGKTHIAIIRGTRDQYTPGDFQGKIQDRPTTPELGKSLGEDPGKTKLRMDAQASGETSYTTSGGKKEYSGRIEKKPTISTTITRDPDKTKMGKARIVMNKTVEVTRTAPDANSSSNKGRSGIAIQRSSGSNKQGKPQNYMSLNRVNKAGEKKTLLKVKTFTPGTKSRTGSTIIPRKKY
jgi:hypothetical protein